MDTITPEVETLIEPRTIQFGTKLDGSLGVTAVATEDSINDVSGIRADITGTDVTAVKALEEPSVEPANTLTNTPTFTS